MTKFYKIVNESMKVGRVVSSGKKARKGGGSLLWRHYGGIQGVVGLTFPWAGSDLLNTLWDNGKLNVGGLGRCAMNGQRA